MSHQYQIRTYYGLILCSTILTPMLATSVLSEELNSETSVTLQAMPDAGDKALQAVTSSSDYKGTLIYGDYAPLASPEGPKWTPFLKLSKTGGTAQPQSLSIFKVNGVPKVYDPQFSPDGKIVMFKTGRVGYRYSYYQLCFWNRATNEVQTGPDRLNFLYAHWSPDSHYVAYIRGGDIEGNETPTDRLKLFIYDVKARTSRFVAENPMAKLMAWTPENTLLYSVKQPLRVPESKTPYQADLYVVPGAGSSKPKLFLENAFDPPPSPNGKKVAFFAWPQPDTSAGAPKSRVRAELGIYSYDLEQKKRTLLRPSFSHIKFVGMRWLPDNRKLVTLHTLSPSPQAKVQVGIIDTLDLTLKNSVILQAKDFEFAGARLDTQPQFQLVDVSTTGKQLLIQVSEFVGRDAPKLIEDKSLQSLDLATGEVVIVTKVRSSLGIDWHADNQGTAVVSRP